MAPEPVCDSCVALEMKIEQQHVRGLELAKALTVCITAMNPPDRNGISMYEWNQRLKAATKQAAAVFDGSVCKTGQDRPMTKI